MFPALAGDGAYKLNYDGDSLTTITSREHLKLYLDQNQIRVAKGNVDVLLMIA